MLNISSIAHVQTAHCGGSVVSGGFVGAGVNGNWQNSAQMGGFAGTSVNASRFAERKTKSMRATQTTISSNHKNIASDKDFTFKGPVLLDE